MVLCVRSQLIEVSLVLAHDLVLRDEILMRGHSVLVPSIARVLTAEVLWQICLLLLNQVPWRCHAGYYPMWVSNVWISYVRILTLGEEHLTLTPFRGKEELQLVVVEDLCLLDGFLKSILRHRSVLSESCMNDQN